LFGAGNRNNFLIHLLGALLEPSLSSRVEREETLNTPLWGGLADLFKLVP